MYKLLSCNEGTRWINTSCSASANLRVLYDFLSLRSFPDARLKVIVAVIRGRVSHLSALVAARGVGRGLVRCAGGVGPEWSSLSELAVGLATRCKVTVITSGGGGGASLGGGACLRGADDFSPSILKSPRGRSICWWDPPHLSSNPSTHPKNRVLSEAKY